MITTPCPKSTTLTSAVTVLYPCPQEFGQIQKIIVWRRGNSIASVATAIISTTWTTLLTATGNTKALVMGFVIGKLTPGEAREAGGGNETKDGIPKVIGGQPTVYEGYIHNADQDQIKALKKLMAETLDAVFVNENGQFGYLDTKFQSTTPGFYGSPIDGLFIGDLEMGDFDGIDRNKVMFRLPSNWSDNFEISAATNFALTLVNS